MGATQTWIDSVGYSGSGGGWFDITRGEDYQAGDLFLVVILSGRAITTGPAGWTLVPGSPWGTNRVHAYYKIATGSEPATYRVTFASNGGFASIATGWRATGPNQVCLAAYDVYPSTGSASIVAHSITTTVPDCTILGVYGHLSGDIAIAPPDGMTEFCETPTTHLEACSYDTTGTVTTGDKTATAAQSVSNAAGCLFAIYGGASIDGDVKIEDSYTGVEGWGEGIATLSDSTLACVVRQLVGAVWDHEVYHSEDKGATWTKKLTFVSGGVSLVRGYWIGDSLYAFDNRYAVNLPLVFYRVDYTPATKSFAVGVNGATVRAAISNASFSLANCDREPGGRVWVAYGRQPTSDWVYVDASYSDDNGATWALSTGLANGLYGYPPTIQIHCLEKNSVAIIGRGGTPNSMCQYAYRLHTEAANTWHVSTFFLGSSNNDQGTVASVKLRTTPSKQIYAAMFEPVGVNQRVYDGRLVEADSAPYGLTVTAPHNNYFTWNTTGSEAVTTFMQGNADGYRLYYCYSGTPWTMRRRNISLASAVAWESEAVQQVPMLRAYSSYIIPRSIDTAYNSANVILAYSSGASDALRPRARCALATWGVVETPIARGFTVPFEALQRIDPRRFRLEIATEQKSVLRRWALPVAWEGSVIRRGFLMPIAFLTARPIVRDFRLEVVAEASAGPFRFSLPIEWTGTRGLSFHPTLPVEVAANPGRDFQLPIEWLTGRLPGREFLLPIGAKGAIGRGFHLPVEATGQPIIYREFLLPIATVNHLLRDYRLPVEWSGEESARIIHRWAVLRKATGVVPHEWVVVATVEAGSLLHEWNVNHVLNGGLVHIWRVLPREIVSLYSSDIQLPFGEVEKTS